MKLSTLSSKMSLLSVNSNAKTSKSSDLFPDTLTAILYLSPHKLAGHGNVCPHATDGCMKTCLYSAGRGKFSTVQQARIKKTKLFFEDNDNYEVFSFSNQSSIARLRNDVNVVLVDEQPHPNSTTRSAFHKLVQTAIGKGIPLIVLGTMY